VGVLAFNDFTLGVSAVKTPPWRDGVLGRWTDQEDRLTANWLQGQGIFVSVDVAAQAVQTVARDCRFHPVRNYLDGLRWDGIQRLGTWLREYLAAEESEYSAAVGKRWLISAVARIYEPGAKADSCLIIEGPQGCYKSTAARTLALPWFTDEIADLGSKDAALQTMGVWIIEIPELDSMSRTDVSRIKAFISRTVDRFRPPYGKQVIEAPRQCVFVGTVNLSTYLRDETGGRRFWPIRCGQIRIEELARDRDQLWAEAVHRYRAGEIWWLDTAELNRQAQEEQDERFDRDPWHPIIETWAERRESVTVEGILGECLEKPGGMWSQADRNRVGRCLRAMRWERKRKRENARLTYEWRRAE
jgi:predicted P-loop ATPase